MTSQMVNEILKEAEKHNAKKITAVEVKIGELSFLNPEQIRFAFDILTEGTIMEKSTIKIEMVKATVECSSCNYHGPVKTLTGHTYHLVLPSLQCPKCGKTVKITKGRDLIIDKVAFEV